MAEKVEVVIKIPKYYLTHPQDYSCLPECVRRGTILPKGHGRIGDLDRLYNVFEKNVVSAGAFKELFDHAPTIIEKDGEYTKQKINEINQGEVQEIIIE